jgi:phytoene dehydrogenase-like protein
VVAVTDRLSNAVVVGSGPNGLAAAITLARAGLKVSVLEALPTAGGGCRTEKLTLPGCLHDVCSAVHPLLAESPFFQSVDLAGRGVELSVPEVAFAHPLDNGRAGSVTKSVVGTASRLGPDALAYRQMFDPLVAGLPQITPALLAPMRSIPPYPLEAARFAAKGILPAKLIARRFETDEARALFAGAAAHSMLPLGHLVTGSFGLLFIAMAHSCGWPLVRGGSARITDALVAELESLGGSLQTGHPVSSLDEVSGHGLVMFDTAPLQLLQIAGSELPWHYRRSLQRIDYGPGVCKVDWVLQAAVPWEAEVCRKAGTVHVGGTFEEVANAEAEVAAGRHSERPFCLVAQPSVVDSSRAPDGLHVLWAYCHVPAGSPVDMTERMEKQIERFAPGFRDLVIARVTRTAQEVAKHNANCVGGSISGGLPTLRQTVFRPTMAWSPYRTPIDHVYLCSASTPPGAGVHGMCGYYAARSALASNLAAD